MSVIYLSLEDLLTLAEDIGTPTVRDLGLLDAAAHRPQSTLFGTDAYASIHEKAAVLLESLTRNHPLIDGNKRLGWLATFVFLGLNALDLDAPDDEAYDLVIGVATGQIDYTAAAKLLQQWTRAAPSK